MKILKRIDLPLEANEAAMDYLGNSLLGIREGSEMCVIDVEAGNLLFTIDRCISGVADGRCVGDEKAIYIARERKADRFMTAHDRKTGAEIWSCQLSKNSDEFCSPLAQDDKYTYHTDASKIIVVDKATGKVINKFKVQNEDITEGGRYIIPWRGKVLYSGWVSQGKGKNKQQSLVLSIYDPLSRDNAYLEDVLTLEYPVGVVKAQLFGDMLFYISHDITLRVIDLNTKKVVFEHDFSPDGEQSMCGYLDGYVSEFVKNGDKIHFMVLTTDVDRNENDNFTHHRYFTTLDTASWQIDVTEEQDDSVSRDYYYDGVHSFRTCGDMLINKPNREIEERIPCEGLLNRLAVINDKMCVVAENEDESGKMVLILSA